MLKRQGSGIEIRYKGCPTASDVFNIVHTEHLPAFRQICRLLVGCAMSNSTYGRTFSYPKIKLLTAVSCIKSSSHFLSLALFLCGRLDY